MSTQNRCRCQSCMIRGMLGPAVLITLGILFLLGQTHGGRLDFGNTWPVLLLTIGIILLAASLASQEGHVESSSQAVTAEPPRPVPPAPVEQPPSGGPGN